MMGRFAKEQPVIWSMLSQGKLLTGKGNTVQWQPKMKEGSEYFLLSLNKEDKRKIITDALNELAGTECSFEAVAFSDAAPAANQTEEAYIQQLYDTFGKEPVDIVDKI